MNKLYVFLGSCLLVISTWAMAEEAELLDAYLEDLPSTSTAQQLDSDVIVGQPVEIVVDENGQSREVIQPQTVEYRRIKTADGSEVYKEVPIDTVTPATRVISENQVGSEVIISEPIVVNSGAPAQNQENLEIIELEPDEGEFVVIEAPENQTTQTVATTNTAVSSGAAFCQQNPYARECLLSKYLSLCRKDPQSADCKSELQKFDRFCGAFPRAYKCKKANFAASCKQNPNTNECKSFTQRYCQKYPKAIFCNYN